MLKSMLLSALTMLLSTGVHAAPEVKDSLRQIIPVSTFDGSMQKTWQTADNIKRLDSSHVLYDFGKDAFGQIEITLSSDSDSDTAFVHLGECLSPEGRVDREPGGSRRYRELAIALKKGAHKYIPEIEKDEWNTREGCALMPPEIGEVIPFRYCEIESKESPSAVARIMVTCPFDDDASCFHCDNDTLNKVWELCKYSIKETSFSGLYVDGDRERRPYEADALINQLGHYCTDASYDMARRTFEHLLKYPTWPTEWILQMDLVAYNDYLFTGSTDLISKHYDELVAHTLMPLRNSETGLISSCLGQSQELLESINKKDTIRDIVDWPHSSMLGLAEGQGGEDDGYVYTDYNTVVNAFHYMSVKSLAEMAKAIGKTKDAARFTSYCRKLKKDFNRQLLDKSSGIYVDGTGTDHSSLHANMFALAFGLVPKEYEASVTDFIVSRGMRCSVYGSQFLLEALYKAGRADIALKLMTSGSNRSWMNMIREGSTVSMEAWGNEWKPNQDWNHAWGSAPANIIPMYFMGISPAAPGFSKVRICPQMSSVRNAECLFPTPKGQIRVTVKDGKVTYIVPEGMKVCR